MSVEFLQSYRDMYQAQIDGNQAELSRLKLRHIAMQPGDQEAQARLEKHLSRVGRFEALSIIDRGIETEINLASRARQKSIQPEQPK